MLRQKTYVVEFHMNRVKSMEGFIQKSMSVHGDRYDYSNSVYVNVRTPLTIICPIHGEFMQAPTKHYKGAGCQRCGALQCSITKTKSTAQFIEEAQHIHGDKYDYSLVVYKGNKKKIDIICPIHGVFTQSAGKHLTGGCTECGYDAVRDSKLSNNVEFMNKAAEVHGALYDYSKVEYKSAKDKVTIICSDHGEFYQRPNGHLRGAGCPKCGKYGFDPFKPATLYYLSVDNGTYYKIGITNRSVKERFTLSDMRLINVIKTWDFVSGEDARTKETKILKRYKEFRYVGDDILSSGNSELFNVDVLGLDIKGLR